MDAVLATDARLMGQVERLVPLDPPSLLPASKGRLARRHARDPEADDDLGHERAQTLLETLVREGGRHEVQVSIEVDHSRDRPLASETERSRITPPVEAGEFDALIVIGL